MPFGGKNDVDCPSCGHARSGHSREGCMDFDLKTNKPCPCKKKYMDLSPPNIGK